MSKPNFVRLQSSIVDHCNLTCNNCVSYSPFLKKGFYDLEVFRKEINQLAKFVTFTHFEFSGGEVLLHPEIDKFIDIAKDSKISENVIVFTNGILLTTMSDKFFELVDKVYITEYPDSKVKYDNIKHFLDVKKQSYNFEYEFRLHDKFLPINRAINNIETDMKVVQQTFDTCYIADMSKWSCHLLSNGIYYKCGKPSLDNLMYGIENFKQDGTDIFSEEMPYNLYRYLKDKTPLDACKRCNGTKLNWVKHNFIPAEKIKIVKRKLNV